MLTLKALFQGCSSAVVVFSLIIAVIMVIDPALICWNEDGVIRWVVGGTWIITTILAWIFVFNKIPKARNASYVFVAKEKKEKVVLQAVSLFGVLLALVSSGVWLFL